MKKIIIILFSFFLLSCSKNKEDFNIDKYISLSYKSYEIKGKTHNYVTYDFPKINDSIGKLIQKRKIAIGYLLRNRIKFGKLGKLYPDSTSIETKFRKKLNSDSVKPYVHQILFPKKYPKKSITEKEVMLVASRFILVKKTNRGFGGQICFLFNGQKEINVDNILLESIIMEIIRYNLGNKKVTPDITSIINKYILKSYENHQNIKSLDSLEPIIKKDVFNFMFSNQDYKRVILNSLKENKDNIPFTVVSE